MLFYIGIGSMFLVNEPSLVVYDTPQAGAHIEDILPFGAKVVELEEKEGWVKGEQGWMEKKHLLPVESIPSANAIASHRGAYLFAIPDTEWGPIFTLPFEAPVEIEAEHNHRWVKVKLFNGLSGYMQRSQLSTPKKMTLPEVLDFAKQFSGIKYLYGGTTSFGYDCSGFVQMLYRQMGITLPRNSYNQAVDPQFQDVMTPQAGDLLFFKNKSGKVTHVGFMLNEEEFIHAFTQVEAWVCTGKYSDPKWSNGEVYYGTFLRRLKQ